jgi:hypothetical protein
MTSSGSEQKGSYAGKRAGGDTSRTNQADQDARKHEPLIQGLGVYQKDGKPAVQRGLGKVKDRDPRLHMLIMSDAMGTVCLSGKEFIERGRVAHEYNAARKAYDAYGVSVAMAESFRDAEVQSLKDTREYAEQALGAHKDALAHVERCIESSAAKILKKEQESEQLVSAEADVMPKSEEMFTVAGGKKGAKGPVTRSKLPPESQSPAKADDPAPDSPGSGLTLKDKLLAELAQLKDEHGKLLEKKSSYSEKIADCQKEIAKAKSGIAKADEELRIKKEAARKNHFPSEMGHVPETFDEYLTARFKTLSIIAAAELLKLHGDDTRKSIIHYAEQCARKPWQELEASGEAMQAIIDALEGLSRTGTVYELCQLQLELAKPIPRFDNALAMSQSTALWSREVFGPLQKASPQACHLARLLNLAKVTFPAEFDILGKKFQEMSVDKVTEAEIEDCVATFRDVRAAATASNSRGKQDAPREPKEKDGIAVNAVAKTQVHNDGRTCFVCGASGAKFHYAKDCPAKWQQPSRDSGRAQSRAQSPAPSQASQAAGGQPKHRAGGGKNGGKKGEKRHGPGIALGSVFCLPCTQPAHPLSPIPETPNRFAVLSDLDEGVAVCQAAVTEAVQRAHGAGPLYNVQGEVKLLFDTQARKSVAHPSLCSDIREEKHSMIMANGAVTVTTQVGTLRADVKAANGKTVAVAFRNVVCHESFSVPLISMSKLCEDNVELHATKGGKILDLKHHGGPRIPLDATFGAWAKPESTAAQQFCIANAPPAPDSAVGSIAAGGGTPGKSGAKGKGRRTVAISTAPPVAIPDSAPSPQSMEERHQRLCDEVARLSVSLQKLMEQLGNGPARA